MWLSQGSHSAWAELQALLHCLGIGGVAELHKQQFLMHRWNKRKKKLCSSQLEPKKGSVGVFKIIFVEGQMHFTFPKCSDLFL